MATKTIDQLAREVIHGKWGAGKTRKEKLTKAGYDYDTVQKRVNELVVALDVLDNKYGKGDQRKAAIEKAGYDYNVIQDYVNSILASDKDRTFEEIVEDMNYWATKTAADNRYHYNKWGNSLQSHLCPICSGLKFEDDKAHFGWNCIGFTAAVWRHGGRLGNTCKCGWVSCPNGNAEYLLSRPADEALKLAKRYIGLNNVVLIRNKSGIPKSQWKAGDICFRYNGDTCDHLFYYMGDGKIADATGSNGTTPNDTQINVRSYKNYSAKVILRYTGGKKPTPTPKKYTGKLPTTKLVKTNAGVKADAVRWAKWIASDNRFGYGRKGGSAYKGTKEYSITHSGGCHFCGTNAKKIARAKAAGLSKPEEWEYTFVCNTFVHAAYAHAGVQSMLKATNHSWWVESFKKHPSDWKEIKKPAKMTDLQPGDVCATDTHFTMYIGNGKGIQATSQGDARQGTEKWKKCIATFDFASFFKKTQYVLRYVGSINTKAYIKYGEISERVSQIQEFLNWYYDGKFFEECGKADGLYGDNTLRYVKKFQLEKFGKGEDDGIIGEKTLAAMAAATK